MNKDLKEIYDKILVIKNILMDEFPELSKEKAELIANRIYDLDGKFEQFCESLGQTKTVAAERAFRMYMDAMKQNPE